MEISIAMIARRNSTLQQSLTRLVSCALLAAAVCTAGVVHAADESLAAIQQRGKLLSGVKYDTPPFGFLNDKNAPVGFDLDIVALVAKRLNVPVEFVKVTSPTRIPMLAAGNVDLVAASMSITPERAQVISFSDSYYIGRQSLMVPVESTIQGPQDLNGKTVAVQQGTTLEQTIMKLAPTARLMSFKDYDSAWLAFMQGRADAFTGSEYILRGFIKNSTKFKIVGKPFTAEPFGLGVQKGNTALLKEVNKALAEAQANGEYGKLYQKWFGMAPTSQIGASE